MWDCVRHAFKKCMANQTCTAAMVFNFAACIILLYGFGSGLFQSKIQDNQLATAFQTVTFDQMVLSTTTTLGAALSNAVYLVSHPATQNSQFPSNGLVVVAAAYNVIIPFIRCVASSTLQEFDYRVEFIAWLVVLASGVCQAAFFVIHIDDPKSPANAPGKLEKHHDIHFFSLLSGILLFALLVACFSTGAFKSAAQVQLLTNSNNTTAQFISVNDTLLPQYIASSVIGIISSGTYLAYDCGSTRAGRLLKAGFPTKAIITTAKGLYFVDALLRFIALCNVTCTIPNIGLLMTTWEVMMISSILHAASAMYSPQPDPALPHDDDRKDPPDATIAIAAFAIGIAFPLWQQSYAAHGAS